MNQDFRNSLFNEAKKWVLEAGSNIRRKINDPLIINSKSNSNDLVTTMDKETEAFFASKIKDHYPEHLLLGEEGYGDDVTSLDGIVWIVDPIDGTTNFVHQKKNFAISLAIYHDDIGEIGLIYDVMSDVLYSAKKGEGAYKNGIRLPLLNKDIKFSKSILCLNHAWLCKNNFIDENITKSIVGQVRGTRTYGVASLEFAYVAEGSIDGYLSMRLSPWDIAAGMIIVDEVGGVTSNTKGQPVNMLKTNAIIVCNSKIYQDILSPFLIDEKSDSFN